MIMRYRLPLALNVLVPGAGLVMLRREWLGLCLAVLFTLVSQIWILGRWIVPMDIPRWASAACGIGAICVWVLAEWLCLRRARVLAASSLEDELQRLFQCCREAVQRHEWQDAQAALQIIQRLDDERPEAALLAAEVFSGLGRDKDAARWRRRAASLPPGSAGSGAVPDPSSSP